MLLLNNLRPSGEEVKVKNEKHLTRVYAPARWASVVNARQTNHNPLRCCRPRLHAAVQDRRTRPATNANCQPLQFGDTKEKKHERKNNFPTSKSAVYERYCNFALALGAAAKHGFRPKRHPPRISFGIRCPPLPPLFPLTIAR